MSETVTDLERKLMLRTVRQLEQELGVPRRTTYWLAKQGLVPCYRVGAKGTGLRFLAAEVLAAMRSDGQKAAAPITEQIEA